MPATLSSRRPVQVLHPNGREVRTKIYFILCRTTGRVKCGIALWPRKRLANLQVGSPTPLELIAELDGNQRREKAIHRRLGTRLFHGEWFRYDAFVRDIMIEELTACIKDREHGLYVAREELNGRLPQPYFPP